MESYIKYIIEKKDPEAISNALKWRGDEQLFLFKKAREARSRFFNNFAEIRSVIEVSNICRQQCLYCTMGKQGEINPYTLDADNMFNIIKQLILFKKRETILLQSGENGEQKFVDLMSNVCERIMKEYPSTKLVLCFGNLNKSQYQQLYNTGASRYIIKFECSNPDLYKWYKNERDTLENRLQKIHELIEIGFKVGSGNIVGLPKQSHQDLVNDLLLTTTLNLSMVSSTVFIPNERSYFAHESAGDLETTLNLLALLRLLNPNCLIPATSSLEKMGINGQLRGLNAGCNTLTIHDGTPKENKSQFPIYSDSRYSPKEQHCFEILEKAGMQPKSSLI